MTNTQVASDKTTHKITDLNNIAISFSGGGYRASAFHLGSLDLLDKIGLRENVTMLSTVSGGSITGGKYACALSEAVANSQPDFYESFYSELHTFMLSTRLPDLWFDKLHPEDTDKPSLIAAAADVYNERLFKGARFEELITVKDRIHLKEITLNTTELRTGNNFRFRVGDGGTIGNYFMPIPDELLQEVRISDVVAASSCFPGGFEPIVFPNDFKFSQDWSTVKQNLSSKFQREIDENPQKNWYPTKIIKTLQSITEEPVPLVDGGIYDNFGTDSLFVADRRFKKKGEPEHQFDTLIVSDTDNIGVATDTDDINKRESLFKISLPLPGNWRNRITLKQLARIIDLSFVLFLLSTISFAASAFYSLLQVKGISFNAILNIWASIVFGAVTFLISKVNNFFKQAGTIPKDNSSTADNDFIASLQEIIKDWKVFLKTAGNLSIVDILNMTGIRLLSFSSLFLALLKGQRRQSYQFLDELQKSDRLARNLKQKYGDIEEIEDSKKINVVNNFILEVVPRSRNFWLKKNDVSLPDYLEPTPEMEQVAIDAAQTATTLWFDEDPVKGQKELDNVIACGQFTMCFTLLRLIAQIEQRPDSDITPEIEEVRDRAIKIWQQLQQNPYFWVGENRAKAIREWSR